MDCSENEHPDISIKVEPITCCSEGNTEQTPFLRHCLDDAEEQHNRHSCGEHHHSCHHLSTDEPHHHNPDEQHQHCTEEQLCHPSEGECCSTATSYPCQGELSEVWVQGSPLPVQDEIDSIDMNEEGASNQANLHGSRSETEVIYFNGYQATDVYSNGHDMANTNENRHEISNIDKNGQHATINGHNNCYEMTPNEHEMTNCCSNEHENVNNDSNERTATSTVNSCLHETVNNDTKTDLHDILLWSNDKDLSTHDLETDRKKCSRCHIKSASGDPHPNCLGHSRCFKRYIWDPRYCDYCNELKRRAERREETALRVYKKRIKNMGRLAWKHRTSNHWIHPMASHYRINQHGFTKNAETGNDVCKYQRNISDEKQLDSSVFIKKENDFSGFEGQEISSSTLELTRSSSALPPFSTSQVAGLPSVDAEPSSTGMEVVETSCVAPTSHDRPPTDSSSTMSRKCSQCAAYVTLGDTHPNCLAHSSCFKNFTWDPRSCSFCNELREGAVTGNVEAGVLYKRRCKNMIKRARVHGNSQVWINPLAVDYVLPNRRQLRGLDSFSLALPESKKALATANDEPTSAECTPKDIALDQRHDKIFKDTIIAERICSVCPSLVVAGDKHPNCLRHSCCFKISVWDPQNCRYCIDLKQRTDNGLEDAVDLFRLRLKAMNILALRYNKKLTSTIPQWLPAAGIKNQSNDSGIKKRYSCGSCHLPMGLEEEHPNCIRHSDCFKNYTWEPRSCQYCIALKLKAENNDTTAARRFGIRVNRMQTLAWENGAGFSTSASNWLTEEKVAEEAHRAYRKLCGVCRTPIDSADSHPNCSRHSQCFHNGVWDPRQCSHCISLWRLYVQRQEEAVKLSRKRLKNMRISAKKNGLEFSTTAPAWLDKIRVVSPAEADQGSGSEVECMACSLILSNGDPHTCCVRHSACFHNSVWDPRGCLPCNELRSGAKQGDTQAKAVYRARFIRMRHRAWVDGVKSSRWIHQKAAAFHLTNVFSKAAHVPAGKQTDGKSSSDPKTGTKKLNPLLGSSDRISGEEQRHLPERDDTSSIFQLLVTAPANDPGLPPPLENSKTNARDWRIHQTIANKLLVKAKTMAVTKRNSVAASSLVEERHVRTHVKLEPNADGIFEHFPDASSFPDVCKKFYHNTPTSSNNSEFNSSVLENPPTPKLNFVFQDVRTETSRTVTQSDPHLSVEHEEVNVDSRVGRSEKETPLDASRKPSDWTEQVRILVVRLQKLTEVDITPRFCCDHDMGLLNGVEILMGLRQLEMAGATSRNEDRIHVDEESRLLVDAVSSALQFAPVPDTADAGVTDPLKHGGPMSRKTPSSTTTRFITLSATIPSASRSTDSSTTSAVTSSVFPGVAPDAPPFLTPSALPFDTLCLDSVRVSGTLFQCPVCPKTIKGFNKYRYHYMVHSMEKPHQCSKCPLAFRQPIHLKRHNIRAHNHKMAKGRNKLKLMVKFPRMSPSKKDAATPSISSPVSTYLSPSSAISPQPPRMSSANSDPALLSDNLQRQVTVQLTKSRQVEIMGMGPSSSKHLAVATTQKQSLHPTTTKNKTKEQGMPLRLLVPPLTIIVPFHQLEVNQYKLPKIGCHQCPVCGRIFKDRREFKHHYMIHSEEMPYTCSRCEYKSRSKSNLRQHIRKYHPDHISALSKTTAVPFNQLGALALTSTGGLYKCPVCLKTSKRFYEFRAHYMIHSNEYPFQCRHCQYQSRRAHKLKRHVIDMHGSGSAMQKLVSKGSVSAMSSSKSSGSVVSNLVSKDSGSTVSKLASKSNGSTVPEPAYMGSVNTVSDLGSKSNENTLSELISKGNGNTVSNLASTGNGSTMSKLAFKGNGNNMPKLAPKVSGSGRSKLASKSKKVLHGTKTLKNFTVSIPPYEKMFPDLARKPGEAYRCPVCRKEYKDKRLFKSHYMSHSGEKPFECQLCPFRSNHRRSLTGHRYLLHPNVYPRPAASTSATES